VIKICKLKDSLMKLGITWCRSNDSIVVKKIGIKIHSGYGNNDETLLGVTLLGHPVYI